MVVIELFWLGSPYQLKSSPRVRRAPPASGRLQIAYLRPSCRLLTGVRIDIEETPRTA